MLRAECFYCRGPYSVPDWELRPHTLLGIAGKKKKKKNIISPVALLVVVFELPAI